MIPSVYPVDESRGAADSQPELPLDIEFRAGDYPRTAQQLAYTVLRRSIMNGTLAPNTHLSQAQIASQLSISTTPVREALRRLAGDALVRIDAHRGAIVRELNTAELTEIYEVRLLLEPLAIRKAAERISPKALDEAESLCIKMDDSSDTQRWADLNSQFHAIFAESADSPTLARILSGLRDGSALYVQWSIVTHPNIPVTANVEHRQIVKALRDGDANLAAGLAEQHLRATLAALTEASQ